MLKLTYGLSFLLVSLIFFMQSSHQADGSYITPDHSVVEIKLALRPAVSPSPSPSASAIVAQVGAYALSNYGTSSAVSADTAIPNNSVTLTTTGRPIMLGLMCTGTNACGVSATGNGYVEFFRGATAISYQPFTGGPPAMAFYYIDAQPAGTYTYTVHFGPLISGTATATFVQLYAYEQ